MSEESVLNIDGLEVLLEPLDDETRNTVMLAVSENWRVPPMTRETIAGDDDAAGNFLKRWPSITNENSGLLDFDKVDKMMATGQIAYPMMLKKAPVISIVRSASGFTVKSSDERLARVAQENLRQVLPKNIGEILTYLEYGAYFSEVTYEPVYPQEYGLPRSNVPYWVIDDLNGVHPNTVTKILRNDRTKAFEGFVQQPTGFYEPIEIGTDRALIIPNNGEFGNLNGESVLEPVYVWWFWYELIWRSFLRFLQRAGVGVVVVKAPSRGRVQIGTKSVDNMQWALQMASGLHRTNYAAVPSDMDSDHGNPLWVVDYLKMGENEGNQFISALELLSNNIKNYLLTGDSNNKEGAEFEVMLDTERILGHIGMYISEHTLPKMWYWNNSSTNKAFLEFQGANSRVLPLLFKLMAVAGNTAGDALQNVDWRMLFNKGGVPVLTEEQVEELKEKKQEEFQKQQETMQKMKAGADEEKAKGQPGGEGRWTSQRDKEGQAEKLEMVREALDLSIITLSPPQVAKLEQLGLRVADDPIVLFNPYHDEEGKFTSKSKSNKGHPGYSDEKLKEKVSEMAAKQAARRFHKIGEFGEPGETLVSANSIDKVSDVSIRHLSNLTFSESDIRAYGSQDRFAHDMCSASKLSKSYEECVRNAEDSYAVAIDNTVYLSPDGVAYTAIFEEHGSAMILHELYHTRKRFNGFFTLDHLETPSQVKTVLDLEEGSTSLLAARDANSYDDPNMEIYPGQMGAIAIIVASITGFDRDRSWEIVDELHFHSSDWNYIVNLFADFMGVDASSLTGTDIYALLQSLTEKASGNNYAALGWLFTGEYVGEKERYL